MAKRCTPITNNILDSLKLSGAMLLRMSLRDLWRWSAVTAAAATLILGLAIDFPRPTRQPTEPAWAAHLRPLRQAPLMQRRPVPLVVPGGFTPGDARKLLMEAAWQRPDVYWRPATHLPEAPQIRELVLVDPRSVDRSPPQGWRRTWSKGWISVLQREVP